MPGFVLEGGTFRTVFSFGVMDALLDHNIYFPYNIGVSAGAAYTTSYVCRQKGRNLKILETYRNDKRYMGLRNFFTDRSLFGIHFAYYRMVTELIPLHFDEYKKNKMQLFAGITNALTGNPEYKEFDPDDPECTLLVASTAIPLLFPAVKLNGVPYYDGGLSDSIPLQKSIDDGNMKNLVVLTRPKGFIKRPEKFTSYVMFRLKRRYPNLCQALLRRPDMYNAEVKLCEKQEKQGNAVVLRPEYDLNSFEKDIDKIRAGYKHGYDTAMKNIDRIRTLFDS
ncbi:MAG: patatin family protein [Treponema sp.]|nr:patatin family protein [Treponema sp.]